MKESFIVSHSFLKLQSIAYLFIILWTLLIKNFQVLFVVWKYVELVNQILFFIYFFSVLISVVLLIIQVRRVYFNDESNTKRVWVAFNIILYYGVVLTELFLITQFRM